jgi:hypothetical protein
MFANFGATACSLLLATLPLNLLTQSGGTNLTYIMMVALHNLVVELYVHFTVKKTKMFLNNVVSVTSGL